MKALPIVSAAIVGILFGLLANFTILNGSWLNLVVWAAVGILIGCFIYERTYIRPAGLSYGFFLSLSFLISGFHGTSDKVFGFGLLTIVLSIFGAGCGWVLVSIGNRIKRTLV
jgi:hypothetical protein